MSRSSLDTVAIAVGLLGSTAMLVASIAAALAYTGSSGEPYSPLNHWVSELGETGVSELATVFNAGLVVGGASFGVFMIGLAATREGWLRLVYGLVGAIAGAAGLAVGLFPMDQLGAHALAALTFFNLGWIAVVLASADFVRRSDRRFPRWLSLVGLLTVAAFVAFLVSLRVGGLVGEDALGSPDLRPDVWIVPILEWALVIAILAWTFLTSLTWWRATQRAVGG